MPKLSVIRDKKVADELAYEATKLATLAAADSESKAKLEADASTIAFAEAIVAKGGEVIDAASKIAYVSTDGLTVHDRPIATIDDELNHPSEPAANP